MYVVNVWYKTLSMDYIQFHIIISYDKLNVFDNEEFTKVLFLIPIYKSEQAEKAVKLSNQQ